MNDTLRADPRALLDAAARDWFERAAAQAAEDPQGRIPALFPQLPRRLGRALLPERPIGVDGDVRVDFACWRVCDAGALWLLSAAGDAGAKALPELCIDLFRHGDMEERTMVLRALGCLPVSAATVELLGEVQRTNTVVHVEAGALDSNVAARAVDAAADRDGARFDLDDFNRLVLKVAFLDLPYPRLLDADRHANPELSRMLQDLATEREAAGRTVWADTCRVIALAPTAGTVARLIGGLEHGDDATRLAAAEGVAQLGRDDLRWLARERLEREPRAAIRAVLARAVR